MWSAIFCTNAGILIWLPGYVFVHIALVSIGLFGTAWAFRQSESKRQLVCAIDPPADLPHDWGKTGYPILRGAVMIGEPMAIQMLLVLGTAPGVYLFLVRPQLNRLAEHEFLLSSLKSGDRIITGGGFVGRIVSCKGDFLIVALADGVHVEAIRRSIESVLPPTN
jgi:preprotein translocase subunit YajC